VGTARRATADDAAELARLRVLMIRELGDLGPDDRAAAALEHACASAFAVQLQDQARFAAYVVDDPDGGLVAGGVGVVDQWLPGVGRPHGLVGRIGSMSTDVGHRRQGHARAVLTGLLGWFSERGVGYVDLHASGSGESLYRAAGFTEPSWPALRWRP
jgi:ribosomal protein S18 acetylase RimI-like enzyme